MTTLKEAVAAIKSIYIVSPPKKTHIADDLLGKYKGIIPKDTTSTEFVRTLRNTNYRD